MRATAWLRECVRADRNICAYRRYSLCTQQNRTILNFRVSKWNSAAFIARKKQTEEGFVAYSTPTHTSRTYSSHIAYQLPAIPTREMENIISRRSHICFSSHIPFFPLNAFTDKLKWIQLPRENRQRVWELWKRWALWITGTHSSL